MSIEKQIGEIKQYMPETYKAIQDKAAKVGNTAYALVKRALRGEPNCFWAMEAGRVMGTPFNQGDIQREVAQYMVGFGCVYVCIFQTLPEELQSGQN